jgi:hypothetical protein
MSMKKYTADGVAVHRDAKTGRMIPAGYGALKGKYVVRKGVDLTKPILDQVSCHTGRKAAAKKRSEG